jgi:hypothetical protein
MSPPAYNGGRGNYQVRVGIFASRSSIRFRVLPVRVGFSVPFGTNSFRHFRQRRCSVSELMPFSRRDCVTAVRAFRVQRFLNCFERERATAHELLNCIGVVWASTRVAGGSLLLTELGEGRARARPAALPQKSTGRNVRPEQRIRAVQIMSSMGDVENSSDV